MPNSPTWNPIGNLDNINTQSNPAGSFFSVEQIDHLTLTDREAQRRLEQLDINRMNAAAQATRPTERNLKSDIPGKYITSPRTFGIEYEVNLSWNHANDLRGIIGTEYNIVRDGSVRDGLEVVSPVLSGDIGEHEVDRVCQAISATGAGTDETTGLHVHFGAKDFFSRPKVEVWPLSSVLKYIEENPRSRNQYRILHDTAIRKIRNEDRELSQRIIRNEAIGFFDGEKLQDCMRGLEHSGVILKNGTQNRNINFFFDTRRRGHNTFHFKELDIQITMEIRGLIREDVAKKIAKKIKDYKGPPIFLPIYGLFVFDPDTSKNMHVLVTKGQNNDGIQLERLQRLSAFYVAFDDVVASMLPTDRRENDYARRASHRMSLEDIRSARSVVQFLMSWFKFDQREQITEANPGGRPRGRYCGLNLFALIKQATIEIRYLGGTLDPARIRHWIILHHAIIDLAADTPSWRGSVDSIDKASLIVNLDRKADIFFKKLRLPPETESYWRDQIDIHKNDDAIIFEGCIEEDARFESHGDIVDTDIGLTLQDITLAVPY